MVSKNIILKTLEESINKTHDGTSLGKLKEPFKKFNEKYSGLDHEEMSIFDGNGNELYHDIGDAYRVSIDEDDISDLDRSEGLHIMHNHPMWYNNVPVILSFADCERLRDIEGFERESLYNSVSATTHNGSTMTIIKNNNFSHDANDLKYNEAMFSLAIAQEDYLIRYKDAVMKYMDEKGMTYSQDDDSYYIEKVDRPQFMQEAEDHVIKELGTFNQFLKKRNVYDKFKEANCKLRINWWNK